MLSYQEIKKLKLHDPLIAGNNLSYVTMGYFPKDKFLKILPKNMSIPSDEMMAQEYPTINKLQGFHPCLLMFSRCYNVHDIITQIELRPYLELLFYFPVIYRHQGEEYLCSYLPVLYLDYLLGVIGGLSLGLRKEFHPKLKFSEADTGASFVIDDILSASFQQISTESKTELDPFFAQIFKKPTVTISYFNQTAFYTASVYPSRILDISAEYQWHYKGVVIKHNENTFASYCEYRFTTSWAMGYKKYFYPKYPVDDFERERIGARL